MFDKVLGHVVNGIGSTTGIYNSASTGLTVTHCEFF